MKQQLAASMHLRHLTNKLAVREDNGCVAADNSTAERQLPQVYEVSVTYFLDDVF
jgi:hypothetical protein